jgi:hypothetical protein
MKAAFDDVCQLGVRATWRMDRLLRQTRTHCHDARATISQGNASWLETPIRCVNLVGSSRATTRERALFDSQILTLCASLRGSSQCVAPPCVPFLRLATAVPASTTLSTSSRQRRISSQPR